MSLARVEHPTLTTFDLFPRLPPEIRHEIWKLSFPFFKSQVEICLFGEIGFLSWQAKAWKRIFAVKREIPPLLHLC